jgi:hypothetical protein
VPSEISRAVTRPSASFRIDVVEALEVGRIFDVPEQRQRVRATPLGRFALAMSMTGSCP